MTEQNTNKGLLELKLYAVLYKVINFIVYLVCINLLLVYYCGLIAALG